VSSVVVTGAAKGIGAGIVDAFVRAGWSVVAVDRDRAPLEQAASRLAGPGKVVTLAGDVSDRATNDTAVKTAVDRFGGLDAAVGNAGVTLPKLIDDTTPEEFDRLFSINVKALMYLAQAAHSALAKSRGSLTVIASKTGLVAQRNSPIYVATKGAAVQLARALALDWAPEGIRVNAVCPGIVDTPMLTQFIDAMPDPAASRREHELAQPLGRLATAAEVASVVLFLASPAAGFITGVALPVDGGFTAE
jgi:NAD(P)-dependent dehydrogenase (short-subunit alcohol dehydrogenase family)